MSRSLKKEPYVAENLMRKVIRSNENKSKKPIKTWSRRSTVFPEMIGHTFLIHNGIKFIPVRVNENMVGHKLGEFSPTRIYRGHTSLDKKLKR